MNVKGVRFERRGWAGAALGLALTAAAAGQGTQPWALSVEGGAAWNARMEIRIPNDAEGTRFDLGDLDDGPYPVFRVEASWRFSPRQGLRLLVAPLEIREEGAFDEDVRFHGVRPGSRRISFRGGRYSAASPASPLADVHEVSRSCNFRIAAPGWTWRESGRSACRARRILASVSAFSNPSPRR